MRGVYERSVREECMRGVYGVPPHVGGAVSSRSPLRLPLQGPDSPGVRETAAAAALE
jgi:hypothetical protein